MRMFAISIGIVLAMSSATLRGQSVTVKEDAEYYKSKIQPILVTHCYGCHSQETKKPKGDFRVDNLAGDFGDTRNQEAWLEVLKRVKANEMPPKSKPRPAEAEIRVLVDWIEQRLRAAHARRSAEGRVVLRRLNRAECEVVRSLGIEVTQHGVEERGVHAHVGASPYRRPGIRRHPSSRSTGLADPRWLRRSLRAIRTPGRRSQT